MFSLTRDKSELHITHMAINEHGVESEGLRANTDGRVLEAAECSHFCRNRTQIVNKVYRKVMVLAISDKIRGVSVDKMVDRFPCGFRPIEPLPSCEELQSPFDLSMLNDSVDLPLIRCHIQISLGAWEVVQGGALSCHLVQVFFELSNVDCLWLPGTHFNKVTRFSDARQNWAWTDPP